MIDVIVDVTITKNQAVIIIVTKEADREIVDQDQLLTLKKIAQELQLQTQLKGVRKLQ